MTQSLINRKKIYFTSMLKTIDDIKNVYSQKYYNMTHQSRKQIKQLYKKRNFLGDQPNGLWYAKHFCRFLEISVNYDLSYDKIQDDKYLQNIDSDKIVQGKYMYGIKIKTQKIYTDIDHPNPNLILRLRNNQDNRKFIKKYGILSRFRKQNEVEEYEYYWGKIAKKFAGIEIDNEKSPIDWTGKCYGCIWNTDIIADLKLLAKRDKRKYSPWEVVR